MRPVIEFIKINNLKDLVGVEIGVYRGHNALEMLKNLDIKKLYLVDPYMPYPEYTDGVWGLKSQTDHDAYYYQALNNLKDYKDKIEFIRKKSQDAEVPDNLDFVYIDGNHNYEYVKADCEKYYNKIKQGGILGGDNYNAPYDGVLRAVNELCILHNLTLCSKYWELGRDWWIIKERNDAPLSI